MNSSPQLLRSPDIIMFNFLNMITSDIGEDIKFHIENSTENKSFLYLLFGEYRIQRYQFFNEAKSVFTRKIDDPSKVFIDLTYNKKNNTPVNLFLTLGDERYSDNVLSMSESIRTVEDLDVMSRRFDRTMSLYIYCQNSNETIMLYEVYKSLIIAFTSHLELLGLRNISLSGRDITEYPEFIPKDFFFRVLSVNFNYETESVNFNAKNLINCFNFNGIPIWT